MKLRHLPSLAWLTRAQLAADPPAARACLAAASGPRRPQYAALAVPLVVGLLLMLLAAACSLAACPVPSGGSLAAVLGDGLAVGLVCSLTGSALGALCAAPPARTTLGGTGVLVIGTVMLLALSASPANAAVRDIYSAGRSGTSFPVLPLLAALPLVVACWWVSAWAVGRPGAAAERESG